MAKETANTPVATAPTAPRKKVVILHSAVGPFLRGQCVPYDALVSDGVSFSRLLDNKAVRLATPDEMNLDVVDLTKSEPESVITVLTKDVERLKAKAERLEAENQMLQMQIQGRLAPDGNEHRINDLLEKIAETDKVVQRLQAELADAKRKAGDK